MSTAAEIIARDLRARQAQIDRRRADLSGPPSSFDELAEVRDSFADLYAKAGAGGAPDPLRHEGADNYRRRLLAGVQGLAPSYRDLDAYALPRASVPAVEREIRREVEATLADKTVGDLSKNGQGLRRVDSVDEYGVRKTEWFGPVWFGASMMPPVQYVRRITTGYPPVVRWAGSRAARRG